MSGDESVPLTDAEGAAWDAYYDNSEVARMCPCSSCNFYLPPEQYKPDSECKETALINAIVAAARADERDRITRSDAADRVRAFLASALSPHEAASGRNYDVGDDDVPLWSLDIAALAQPTGTEGAS